MVVVGNVAVSADGVVSKNNLRADGNEFTSGLSLLAKAIKAEGARACLQLNHGGRFARTEQPLLPAAIDGSNLNFNISSLKNFMNFFPLEQRFGLTRYFLNQAARWRRAMGAADTARIIVDFGQAARRAYDAGFDMVELHGANGYLLCQLLSSFTNWIDAEAEEAFHYRAAIPMAVVREVKKQIPEDFPVGFRLLLREWVPGGIDLEEAISVARLLGGEGVAYFSVSVGTYNSIFSETALKKMAQPAYLAEDVQVLTSSVKVPTIISGRITTPSIAEEIRHRRVADLVGLGRPLRTDFDWIKKARNGRSKVKKCINCNRCLKRVVMNRGFTCVCWPKFLRQRTDLEQKQLTRNGGILWVIADSSDQSVFKSAMPDLLSVSGNPSTLYNAKILFLQPDDSAVFSDATRQSMMAWGRRLMKERGFKDVRLDETCLVLEGNRAKAVHDEIEQAGYGIVFVARNRNQPWRERLLYRESGRAVGLLGTHPRYMDILVPLDLSDSTLLVLIFLRRRYIPSPESKIKFVHVLHGSKAAAQSRWKEILKIVDLDEKTPLAFLPAKEDVAVDLIECIRKGSYGTVIMGKRGLSGIKRWMLGSVSQGVLKGLVDQSLILID
jgi:2,4-dienoyl-CoA reductase (NADPH2)